MLKALKNVWTVTVNVGWIFVIGYAVYTYASSKERSVSTQPPTEAPVQAQRFASVEPTPVLPSPVQEVQKTDRSDRAFVVPDNLVRNVPVSEPLQREPELPELPDLADAIGTSTNTVCSNGICFIVPRLKYTGPFRRLPPPDLNNTSNRREPYEFSAARNKNAELRYDLWDIAHRVVWNSETLRYIDLKGVGPCPQGDPWDQLVWEKIYDQNWELQWRIDQMKLLLAGRHTDVKIPARPRGKKGKVGGAWDEP